MSRPLTSPTRKSSTNKRHLLLLLLLTAAIPAAAQDIAPSHHAHNAGHSGLLDHDSIANRALVRNAPGELDTPGYKHLGLHSKDNRFHLTIGGYAKVTAGYDFGSPVDNPNSLIVADIPMNPAPGDRAAFNLSAMQSMIYFNFVALPGDLNQVGVFVGLNLLANYAPQLQFAYLKYRGLEAGYDYSTFSDPDAVTPTIDYEGPNSFTAQQTSLISYSHALGHHWTVGGGVEQPAYSVTEGAEATAIRQRVPDIPLFARYSWSDDAWIRLSLVGRNLMYRDMLSSRNVDRFGWGIQLSAKTPIAGALTAYLQGVYGRGVASMFQDLSGLGLDMTPDPTASGRLTPVKAWGAYAGLQYDFSKSVYCSVTYSHVRTYAPQYADPAEGATPWGEQYRYGQYAAANIFWSITDALETGIEYIYARRKNCNGAQAHDNRLQAMVQLTF